MSQTFYQRYTNSLTPETTRHLLPPVVGVNFMTNDYLGLSQHPALKAAAIAAVAAYGTGNRAARLAGGNTKLAEAVEAQLAAFKGTETALLFSSGFQLNSTVLPALLDDAILPDPPLVLIDRLAHASLYHGLAAWGGRYYRFAHNDVNHVETLLKKHHHGQPTWVITESVFSMDGDRAPLSALIELKHRFNMMLYVDDAHGTGVFGLEGRGLCHAYQPHIDIVAGTLGKAMGSFGGYVATSRLLRDVLINRCRGFIYTTALPPAVLGAVSAALALLPTLEAERAHVLKLSLNLKKSIIKNGFDCLNSSSPIVPLVLGSNSAVLRQHALLANAGYAVAAIRPPTVPTGTARLRFSLTAKHSDDDIKGVIAALGDQREAA